MTDRTENRISGGVYFGTVIQGRYITLTLPDRPDPALAGLPRRSSTFSGRRPALEQALAALAPEAPEPAAGTVVVTGLAGMGKTELVVQTAHRALREDNWFPGGVLFIDMHGYDTEHKVSPKRALGTLLRALGIPPEHIPPGLEERASVYRSALSALAGAGQRVLVVLDDVPATEKIRHLLPGDGSTATLISSRHALPELDARLLTLRELPIHEGRELLESALRTAVPDDSRVAADPDGADRLVALCGGLPLALRILASLLVDVPAQSPSSLLREFLDALPGGSLPSREERSVTSAFDLSYRRLTKAQAKLFRRVSLHPGPDFSTEAAAQLFGESVEETRGVLQSLARRHMVEPKEPYGRWRQHHLVRLYAREQLTTSDDAWGEGLMRLFAHFHKTATLACETLFAPAVQHSTTETVFGSRAEALQWLEVERHSLVTAALLTHKAGDDLICVALAVPTSQFLMEMHFLEDAGRVLNAGIQSSRRLKDRHREAALLSSLGVVLRGERKLPKSMRAQRKAVKISRSLKEGHALAGALNNLGLSLHEQRKFEEAVAAHTKAARLFKRAGDRNGMAGALSNSGETLCELGRPEEAVHTLRKAAKVFKKQHNKGGYAQALGSLATATRNAGQTEQAVKLHKRALGMPDGLLLPHERAIELSNLAGTLITAGDFEGALGAQQQAADTFRRLGDRHGEAAVLGNMALVSQQQGKWNKAVRLHTLALEAFVDAKDDHGLADELRSLAVTLQRQGNHTEALENLELAADLYHHTGDAESANEALRLVSQVQGRAGARECPADSRT